MENTASILTIREIAKILRCSKAHVTNVLAGKVQGVAKLTHMNLGRRKLVRREWLDSWMEANKTA
jgi:excisionase family DNA binding protein